jgi:NADP-dependent 3-hydroxy acid dehydrogenase YdfG
MQKVVLITGGSSGIGKSIGLYLKSMGLKVYGTTRDLNKHPDFEIFPLLELEVTDSANARETVQKLIAEEGRLDVLVNNAGVGITGPIEETPHEEILKAFDINFNGPLHLIKAVLPQMRRQNSGCIINITSIAGSMGLPYRGIYSATKGAMAIITEALRMETKDSGIRVADLAPGDFATNIAAGRYHAPIRDESPYRETYAKTLKVINDDVDSAGDPILVAKKVYEIINSPKPRVHYRVGDFMQKFSILLKKSLPDKIYEKLVLKHYKL